MSCGGILHLGRFDDFAAGVATHSRRCQEVDLVARPLSGLDFSIPASMRRCGSALWLHHNGSANQCVPTPKVTFGGCTFDTIVAYEKLG